MTLSDVQKEIRDAIQRGVKASDKNLANFLYDVIRKPSANDIWPKFVFDCGFTGKQLVGTGQCFEFVKVPAGAKVPYPDPFASHQLTHRQPIQSLTLPFQLRLLSPKDEMAILQYAIALNIPQTHFALHSKLDIRELTLLQTSARFNDVQVDALFIAKVQDDDQQTVSTVIITCESKQLNERILTDRILRQVRAAQQLPLEFEAVIPIVIQRVLRGGLYVGEFAGYLRSAQIEDDSFLTLESSAIYELKPMLKDF